jgi:deferrochelatase/peroxidase EfeB
LTGLASVSGWKVDEKQCERGMTRPGRSREHFGFVDGISQPGFRDDRLPAAAGRLRPGEFVFGYPTENPEDPGFPGQPAGASGPEWIKNGSLMVVQRFIQRVPKFNAFINKTADDDLAMDRELLAARVVGRWRSGAPLSIAPLQDNPLLGADEEWNNNFDFANDPGGYRCPFAAHICKVYPPNDITAEALDIPAERLGAASEFEKRRQSANFTAKHRIIRRGIPFGPELNR